MNHFINNFLSLIFVLLMVSCESKHSPKVVSEITIEAIGNVYYIPNSISSNENNTVITLFNASDKSIWIYQIDSNNSVTSKNIHSHFLEQCYNFQLYIKSIDSIYHLKERDNFISILDSNGNPSSRLWLDTDFIHSNPENNVKIFNNSIFLATATHVHNVAIGISRALYYQETKPISQIELGSDSILKNYIYGKFPNCYTKDNQNFNDWHPDICATNTSAILVSFACDDSVYLYQNMRLSKSILCKSAYIDEFESIPDNKSFDMTYTISYILHEPKYWDIRYNKYKDSYYRIVKHKDILIDENTVDLEKSKWSIIIMDSNFNIMNEFVFKRNEYSYLFITPSAKGLYLRNLLISNSKDSLTLTLFDL